MAIGINDAEFDDELEDFQTNGNDEQIENYEGSPSEAPQESNDIDSNTDNPSNDIERDFISNILKDVGIEDKSKIKFEDEDGVVKEVNWDSLSEDAKYNILKSSSLNPENDLDSAEIQLINAIRQSELTPELYLNHVADTSVNNYIQNTQNKYYEYSVDQYSDDELFIADYISRMGDVTEEEAQEALNRAKENETLFKKEIGAIRNEYKTIEAENIKLAQIEEEQQAQEQYNQFSQSVVDQINNFTEFSGYDLNLEQDDMQMLYDFITGADAAGNNHFAKALADPATLVKAAWFTLNGEQMLNDVTDYFQKEITKVRQESYNKGLAEANKKMNKSNVVFKNKSRASYVADDSDLDDF